MDKDLLRDFDPRQLARDNLSYFMLYTDPNAYNPSGSYTLKDFHRKIIDVLERVER